jgi:hypothetical protein
VRIYVTKWAFSAGVLLMDAEERGGYMRVVRSVRGVSFCPDLLRPGEWAGGREGAERQVEAMRAKKIAAAKRHIAKLENFVVQWKTSVLVRSNDDA